MTEDRPYDEKELTARLADVRRLLRLRRKLIEDGLMRRESGTYVLTELGRLRCESSDSCRSGISPGELGPSPAALVRRLLVSCQPERL